MTFAVPDRGETLLWQAPNYLNPNNRPSKTPLSKRLCSAYGKATTLPIWLYLCRTYLYFVLVIGGAVWFDQHRAAAGWSFWWNVPVGLLTILLVGAGQHQLSGLGHEGAHHILFRNRWFNDLASDLLCMFPLFSSTHHYRLQHLAHHQFVNDPERDPDVSQLQASGHWLNFPVSKRFFVGTLFKQLWLPNLIRFTRVRAAYNATGTDKTPYAAPGRQEVQDGGARRRGLSVAASRRADGPDVVRRSALVGGNPGRAVGGRDGDFPAPPRLDVSSEPDSSGHPAADGVDPAHHLPDGRVHRPRLDHSGRPAYGRRSTISSTGSCRCSRRLLFS